MNSEVSEGEVRLEEGMMGYGFCRETELIRFDAKVSTKVKKVNKRINPIIVKILLGSKVALVGLFFFGW